MGLGDLQGCSYMVLVHVITEKSTIGHLVCYKGVISSIVFFYLKATFWIPFEMKNCYTD